MRIYPEYVNIPPGYIAYYVSPGNKVEAEARLRETVSRHHRISKFNTMVIETSEAKLLGSIVARRINLGNYNTPAVIVLYGQYHDIDNFAFVQFVNVLLDITSFDTKELLEINAVSHVFNDGVRSCTRIITKLSECLLSPSEGALSDGAECLFTDAELDANMPDFNVYEPEDFETTTICQEKRCFNKSFEEDQALPLPKSRCIKKSQKSVINKVLSSVSSIFPSEEDKLQKAEERQRQEENALDRAQEIDKKECLDRITSVILDYVTRFHEMPPMEQLEDIIAGKIIIRNNGLSPIVVNRDMKVILPDYNELELRFTALTRALYILFLKHPEGIVLKEISDYKNELIDIYLLVKPGRKDKLMIRSIEDLCDPMGDSLRQKISMIKRSINNIILNPSIAGSYIIQGSKGYPYSINAVRICGVSLPAALN